MDLRIPAILMIGALGSDLLQYISSTLSWGVFQWLMERKFQKENLKEESETFGAPNSINWLGNAFLNLKVGFLLVAYGWLLSVLFHRLFK